MRVALPGPRGEGVGGWREGERANAEIERIFDEKTYA
jgi:hypothetical protein